MGGASLFRDFKAARDGGRDESSDFPRALAVTIPPAAVAIPATPLNSRNRRREIMKPSKIEM